MRTVHTIVHTEALEADVPAKVIDRRVAAWIETIVDPAVQAVLRSEHRRVMARNRDVAETLRDQESDPSLPPILVTYAGAARLLGSTVPALRTRMCRGDAKLMAARVGNGRSVRFNVARLTEKFTPGRRRP